MDCMQYANPEFFKSVIKSFNTASGMDCMQFRCFSHLVYNSCVSIPQAVWIACNLTSTDGASHPLWFQYRKRYGLHAMEFSWIIFLECTSFNTASGMDCMQLETTVLLSSKDIRFQYRKRYGLHAIAKHRRKEGFRNVSIPQAVWIACNWLMGYDEPMDAQFQYRKRYGLHAI